MEKKTKVLSDDIDMSNLQNTGEWALPKTKQVLYTDTTDTDVEKINRRGRRDIPPRIIRPAILANLGLNLYDLNFLATAIKSVDSKQKIKGFRERYSKTDSKGNKIYTPHGDVLFQVEVSGAGSGSFISPRNLSDEKLQEVFNNWILYYVETFIEEMFPKHLNFILKDTQLCPMPFPYMEFFIKAEYGNDGNIAADFRFHGDTVKDSVVTGL